MFSGLLIVGDVEENWEEALAKFLEIGVGWLADDHREAFGCLHQEDGKVLRCHGNGGGACLFVFIIY